LPVKPAADRLPLEYLPSYLRTPLPEPVYPVDVSAGITDWGMLGNGPDPGAEAHPAGVNNDLFATLQHYRTAKAASIGAEPPHETSADLVSEYLAYTQGTDSGASVVDLLLHLYKTGRILAFAPVDHTSAHEVDAAMAAFHGVFVGVNLTSDADALFEHDLPWTVSAGQRPDPGDGHCLLKVGAGGREFDTWVTWGAVQRSSRDWTRACIEEAWVVITQEDEDDLTANLDLAALRADIDALHGGEAAAASPPTGTIVDEDVRFTVYRPQVLVPEQWARLVVFAHKTDPVVDPGRGPIDPAEEVEARARAFFAGAPPRPVASDAQGGLARGTKLRIEPELPGLQCNPPAAEIGWWEPVHEVLFRLLAGPELVGATVRGAVRIWCGPLILGEVSIAIRVAAEGAAEELPAKAEAVRRYDKIFASYSHRDSAVVETFALYARVKGDRYLQDVLDLRAGEPWNARLLELIEAADVFQLFWSSHSMHSPHCREEWEHALALQRPDFVRPVYWEDPLPEDSGNELPPAALKALHFAKVPPELTITAGPSATTPALAASPAPGPPAGPPAPTRASRPRRLRFAVASAAAAAGIVAVSLASVVTLSGGSGSPLPGSGVKGTSAPASQLEILRDVAAARGTGFSIGLYGAGIVQEPSITLANGGWIKLTLSQPAFSMTGAITCLTSQGSCKISVYTGKRYLGSADVISRGEININLGGVRMIEIVATNRSVISPEFMSLVP